MTHTRSRTTSTTSTPSATHGAPRRRRAPAGRAAVPPAPRVPTRHPSPPVASFAEAGLPPRLVDALRHAGLTAPFPIQAATLTDAVAGADVLGRAATGSGKTLAFGVPLVARVPGAAPRRPTGLVLVPTRELARQVSQVLTPLAQAVGVRVAAVYGGAPIHRQVTALARGRDVVVATPGRLVDLLERGAVSLDAVEVTVLDEADHLCDLGFLPTVRRLLAMVPAGGQTMLFSATLDGDVDTLVRQFLREPVLVDVAPARVAEPVSHRVLTVAAQADKPAALVGLTADAQRALLFVRTRHGANRLAGTLKTAGVRVHALHGGLAQSARERAIRSFAAGETSVLVATDVAARGVHVDGVDLVVHVDPPTEPKAFLHRSGRTGRAGAPGTVVTVALPEQRRLVDSLLAAAGVRGRAVAAPDDEPVAAGAGPAGRGAAPATAGRRRGRAPGRNRTGSARLTPQPRR